MCQRAFLKHCWSLFEHFGFFFFTKREIEALLADAGLAHFPEMVPNRQVKEIIVVFFILVIA